MHLPTQVLEERAPSTTETALPLDHPIHKKKPPVVDPLATKRDEADLPLDPDIHRKKRSIIDPLPIKRDDLTPTVLPLSHPIHKKEPPIVDPLPIKRAKETPTSELPLDHPIHSKRPPIVDPLLFKRDAPSATVLPLDHPIHKKKPPIVNPVPVDLYPKRENDREAPWKRDDRGGEVAATQDSPASPAAQGGQANAAAAGPQTMIDGLPPCVRKCLFRAPVGKCDPTDFACLCRNDEYLKAVMVSVGRGWRPNVAVNFEADNRTAGRSTATVSRCRRPFLPLKRCAAPRSSPALGQRKATSSPRP